LSAVGKFLRGLKKAELQTIHQFWLPGESANSRVDELRKRVEQVFISGEGVSERVARLSQAQKRLIHDGAFATEAEGANSRDSARPC